MCFCLFKQGLASIESARQSIKQILSQLNGFHNNVYADVLADWTARVSFDFPRE